MRSTVDTYQLVRDYLLSLWVSMYGKPSGDGVEVLAPCACCRQFFPIGYKTHPESALQCDHIHTRHGQEPDQIIFTWDPSNLQFLAPTCHQAKTGGEKFDYAAKNFPEWRAETETLRQRILNRREKMPWLMKWRERDQAEAINAVLETAPRPFGKAKP